MKKIKNLLYDIIGKALIVIGLPLLAYGLFVVITTGISDSSEWANSLEWFNGVSTLTLDTVVYSLPLLVGMLIDKTTTLEKKSIKGK